MNNTKLRKLFLATGWMMILLNIGSCFIWLLPSNQILHFTISKPKPTSYSVRESGRYYLPIEFSTTAAIDTIPHEIVKADEESSAYEEVTTQQPTISNKWNITLTENEIYILAQIVMGEAGSEYHSDVNESQVGVISVIFNRMYLNNTSLVETLSAKGQFATWKNVGIYEPTERVYNNIYGVLSGEIDNGWSFNKYFFSKQCLTDVNVLYIGGMFFSDVVS